MGMTHCYFHAGIPMALGIRRSLSPTPAPTEVQRHGRTGSSCAEKVLSQWPPAGWPCRSPPGAYRTQETVEEPSTWSG